MVKLRLASPRIPAWNLTLAIHFLLRLFFFVEFRPGEITMNEFLGNNRSPRRPPSTSASKNIKMLGILVTARVKHLVSNWHILEWNSWLQFGTYKKEKLCMISHVKCFTLMCTIVWHKVYSSIVCELDTKCITLICDPPPSYARDFASISYRWY